MEKQRIKDKMTTVYTRLMKTIKPSFQFPKKDEMIASCVEKLYKVYGNICDERIVDYCVNQIYFLKSLNIRFNRYISFNQNAVDRFFNQTIQVRYYQDLWLNQIGLSREKLVELIRVYENPFSSLVNPEHEERTKLRKHNTEVGFSVCKLSTYLFNPLSEACQTCVFKIECKELTSRTYPELYNLRLEERIANGE